MNDQNEEETRPLVYEDRVGPLEVQRGRRRKCFCLALTTICIGVGLSLAVALPVVSMSKQAGASKNEEPVALKSQFRHEIGFQADGLTTAETPSLPGSPTSSIFPTSEEETSNSPQPTPDPFAACPEVPKNRRGLIDLEFLEGKLLFEVYRIQTENSPAFVDRISCSVMELDFSAGSNETGSRNASSGTMTLKYLEGFISKSFRTVEVKLEERPSTPNDFVESFGHNGLGRLSLLVQLDGLLLTYECFPDAFFRDRPGYAIHVFSLLPGKGDTELARALLRLADVWGLNPAKERYVQVGKRSCER